MLHFLKPLRSLEEPSVFYIKSTLFLVALSALLLLLDCLRRAEGTLLPADYLPKVAAALEHIAAAAFLSPAFGLLIDLFLKKKAK